MMKKRLIVVGIAVVFLVIGMFLKSDRSAIDFTVPSEASNLMNHAYGGRFLNMGDRVYFSMKLVVDYNKSIYRNGFYQMNRDGTGIKKLYDINAHHLSHHKGTLYFTDVEKSTICKVTDIGGEPEVVVVGTHYAIDKGGNLYYSSFKDRSFIRCLKSNGQTVQLYDAYAVNFQVEDGFLYFIHGEDRRIYRMNLKTGVVTQLTSEGMDKYATYGVLGNRLYYVAEHLYELNLDSGERRKVVEDVVYGFTFHEDALFYVTPDEKNDALSVKVVSLNGRVQTLVKIVSQAWPMYVGGDHLYFSWINSDSELIRLNFEEKVVEPVTLPEDGESPLYKRNAIDF